MIEQPIISIIMPAHNSEKTIKDSIYSVINQSFKNWELIIINDHSSDGTVEIINELCNMDNRIILIKLSHQGKGISAARNSGVKKSRGQYLAFLDSDDLWKTEKLEHQYNWMVKNNVRLTYTEYEILRKDGSLKLVDWLPSSISYDSLLNSNSIGCLTVLIKKELILPFEDIEHEDYVEWLSILKKNKINAFLVPEKLAIYRESSKSTSSNKIESALWTWKIYRNHEQLSVFRALVYFFSYIFNGMKKHFF